MFSSKKYTFWSLKSNRKPLKPKNYPSMDFMGSEIQPGVIRAQKHKIQISRVTKTLYLV
jgi:hypothetical protein